jgi:hypothetical protein
MRILIGLARAVVGFTLLFAFLAAIPVMAVFILMIVVPPAYVVFFRGEPEMLVLTGFGLAGFVLTLATTRGLARLQEWINELFWS